MNIQSWFPLRLTGLISLLSKGFSRVFSGTTVQKHQFFHVQLTLWSNSHIDMWLLEKPCLWLYAPLSAKWCLCFLTHCLLCHSFSSKKQVSFNFMAIVSVHSDFGAQENKVWHSFQFPPFLLPWSDVLVFWMLSCKSAFSFSSFTFIQRLFSLSSTSVIRVVSFAYLRL